MKNHVLTCIDLQNGMYLPLIFFSIIGDPRTAVLHKGKKGFGKGKGKGNKGFGKTNGPKGYGKTQINNGPEDSVMLKTKR